MDLTGEMDEGMRFSLGQVVAIWMEVALGDVRGWVEMGGGWEGEEDTEERQGDDRLYIDTLTLWPCE